MPTFKYLSAMHELLAHFARKETAAAIEQAATLIAATLQNDGAVFCADIGHGNQRDFVNRAGGLAAVQHFTYNLDVIAPVAECLQNRPGTNDTEREAELIRCALRQSQLRAGDVLLIGSVSGKNSRPVQLALCCRELGIRVIGFTSLAYTAQVESLHASGMKLCDVVDVVIDDGAPFGDAAVQLDGYDFNVLPVSGVGNIIAGWLIWERVIERMVEAGTPPSVFMSLNRPGGEDLYHKSRAEFNRRGY